jgi:hypothetical protein
MLSQFGARDMSSSSLSCWCIAGQSEDGEMVRLACRGESRRPWGERGLARLGTRRSLSASRAGPVTVRPMRRGGSLVGHSSG